MQADPDRYRQKDNRFHQSVVIEVRTGSFPVRTIHVEEVEEFSEYDFWVSQILLFGPLRQSFAHLVGLRDDDQFMISS